MNCVTINCPTCGKRLSLSDVENHPFVCKNCDKSFTTSEVEKIYKRNYRGREEHFNIMINMRKGKFSKVYEKIKNNCEARRVYYNTKFRICLIYYKQMPSYESLRELIKLLDLFGKTKTEPSDLLIIDKLDKYEHIESEEYGEYKKKIEMVDEYTDGLCTYILNLMRNYWEERREKKYHNFFGDGWLKHWKMDYDPRDIVYHDENLGDEFKFLDFHHSCCIRLGYKFLINRMVTEIRDLLKKAYRNLENDFGKDSYVCQQFVEQHGMFLDYEDGYDYAKKKIKPKKYNNTFATYEVKLWRERVKKHQWLSVI